MIFMDTEKFQHIERQMRGMICMISKGILVLFISLATAVAQTNLLNGQTLKELNIVLEIIGVNKWEKTTILFGDEINTENYCKDLGSAKKNKQELQKYFLNSIIIDSSSKSYYGVWQCSYEGKIKIFNKIWNFVSVSGVTRISRKIDKTHKNTNKFEKYCKDNICYEVFYLICVDKSCSPRALLIDEYQ